MIYLRFLKNVIAHKWFICVAGWVCGVSIYRCLIHDWSKFTPSEFFGYSRKFQGVGKYPTAAEDARATMLCGSGGARTQEQVTDAFDRAWLHHQHLNLHHWQAWCQVQDNGSVRPIEMSRKYVREMVADWWAAGRGYDGRWKLPEWYAENWDKMHLHLKTRKLVESLIEQTTPLLMRGQEGKIDGEKKTS